MGVMATDLDTDWSTFKHDLRCENTGLDGVVGLCMRDMKGMGKFEVEPPS